MDMGRLEAGGTIMTKWIVRNIDGCWMVREYGGEAARIHTHPDQYTEVEVPDGGVPHERDERYDASSSSKRRPATVQEIEEYDHRELLKQCEKQSMTPEVLASLAVSVRERDPVAWDALSDQQKKAEVTTTAAVWTSMRELFNQGCR